MMRLLGIGLHAALLHAESSWRKSKAISESMTKIALIGYSIAQPIA